MFGCGRSGIGESAAEERRSSRAAAGRRRGTLATALLVLAGPVVVLGVGVSPAAATPQAPTWTQLAPATSPTPREGASMAYDTGTGQLVLFGGFGQAYLGDTWVWSGTTWTQLSPGASPPARFAASMAYDPGTGQLVLFGGEDNSGVLGDTWTWNGTTWTQLSPAASPPARMHASMAYDPATSQFLLYGGFGDGVLGDTWTWSGTSWTQASPAEIPPARAGAAMAYDPGTSQLVLFGGGSVGDTWTWIGWTQISPTTSPSARDLASMADDPGTGQLVLFGGTGNAGPLGDTWTYSFPVTRSMIVSNDSGVVTGGTLTFTATVAGSSGGATPTGTLTWAVTKPGGGSVSCSSTSGPTGSSNVSTYTCSITDAVAGSYLATASYSGDADYSAVSGADKLAVVTASSSTTALSVLRSSVRYGDEESEVFTATVTGTGNTPPTGRVTIKDGASALCSSSAFAHKARDAITVTCKLGKVQLAVGVHLVTASYGGDENFKGSTSRAERFRVTKR